MIMTLLDWGIVLALLVTITIIAFVARKYTRSVADFLAANRLAGRYLMLMSNNMAGIAAIGIIGGFELFFQSGFTGQWWGFGTLPLAMLIAVSGYAVYRYRESRVLTIGQLFEVRYSKNFRIFTGIVAWVSGIVNFGLFPAVGSRFFVYFCGLPETFQALGITCSTFAVVMFVLIAMALFFTFIGGQIAVLITDFFQSMFWYVTMVVIVTFLFWKFDWNIIAEAVNNNTVEGKSLVNPFDAEAHEGFNIWFFLITGYFMQIYGCGGLNWQGNSAYNASAKSAHESRMAKVLSHFSTFTASMVLLVSMCAYTVMNHDSFSDMAQSVDAIADTISTDPADTLRYQMTVPIIIRQLLPAGLFGLFCAAMFAAFISTHDTALHSWGTIFIQDVVLPFRKKPFTPKQHIWLLRLSILFVAVFIYIFALLFKQTEYIRFYFLITGAMYISGIGAVVIGGLYWRRGSTLGAWGAMIWGSTASVTAIVLQLVWPKFHEGESFPINSVYLTFIITLVAIGIYVVLSLLGRHKPFNLDRMLHRGKYALKNQVKEVTAGARGFAVFGFDKRLPRADKLIYLILGVFVLLVTIIFIGGTVYHLTVGIPDAVWLEFWHIFLIVGYVNLIIVTIWFLTGGIMNLKQMFRDLKTMERNDNDGGMVVDHHSFGEEFAKEE